MSTDSPVQQALAAVRELKARLAAREAPIAVVGLACRLGDAPDRAALERRCWDDDPEPAPTLDDPYAFDAAFFGLPDDEARALDPAHRLALEACWHAAQDAGIDPTTLRGTRTGVFVGFGVPEPVAPGPFAASGGLPSMAAARVAYTLGLEGPALTVQTACTSGLVALHLAVRALRDGECDRAVVTAANVARDPGATAWFDAIGALSPSGRGRSFDAAGDGYVRGEGVVAVLLRRLPDATALGDRVRAVIRGTAIGHAGRGNGVLAPRAVSQAAVATAALADAGVSPAEVAWVEGHGTGSPLADAVEVEALARAYGPGPRWLTSAKPLTGNLEPASGLVGLARAVIGLERAQVPPQRGFATPVPELAAAADALRVPVAAAPLSGRVAVHGWGLSGTTAHVVLEPGPAGGRDPLPATAFARRSLVPARAPAPAAAPGGPVTEEAARAVVLRRLGEVVGPVDPSRSLSELGLDSMRAIQLRDAVTADLGVAAPMSAFLADGTVDDVVRALATAPAAPPSTGPDWLVTGFAFGLGVVLASLVAWWW